MNDPVLAYLQPLDLETGPESAVPGAFAHWTLTRDADDIAWALLDRKDASANTLSEAVLAEFDRLLDQIDDRRPRALVLRSAKPAGFLAGADIGEFRGIADADAIRTRIEGAHRIVDRLAALAIPTIAVIHGYAMGGGLEMALACNHRIAVEGARFGFPEVKLGLHPGLGGTVRMTRQIDPLEAMRLMLTGKTIDARKARKLGLVDAVVPERHVRAAVRDAAMGTMEQQHQGMLDRVKDMAPARRLAARQMRAEAEKQAPEVHYPAPYALIDLWEAHGGDFTAMQRGEIDSFARLMAGDTAQNLIRVFFLREKLKNLAGKEGGDIRHVHVIGAGTMGGDIAAWCAWQGIPTSLTDVKPGSIGGAVGRAAALFDRIGHRDGPRIRDALDRLVPDPDGAGIAVADLVIEAAPENLDLKRRIYAAAEARMKADAILATNTSSIPLHELAEGLERPERLIGMHFFNPVSRLDLVEVIRHDRIDAGVESRARAFVGAIGKLPAPSLGTPGFIVNRVLTPYLVEAMTMLHEGIAKETIDRAATDFGMPMGPLELADQVGLDVGLAVAEMLKKSLGWPLPDTPDWLGEKVAKGELGRKSGKGIYVWENGEAVKRPDTPAPTAAMTDRLILPMLNTAVAVWREKVSDDPDVIDAAMIFGTGFAPFRGGPIHYARTRGIDDVRGALAGLAAKHGDRFAADIGWDAIG